MVPTPPAELPRRPELISRRYAWLGILLLAAARNPLEHRILIWFIVWLSLVPTAIMAAQARKPPSEHALYEARSPPRQRGHLATSASGGPGSENCFLICLSALGNHPAARAVASLGLQPSSLPVKMYLSPLCGR